MTLGEPVDAVTDPHVPVGTRSGGLIRHLRGFRELGILMALVVVLALFAAINPVFLSAQNLADVARNASFTFVAAVGATYVFAAGGLDLSVGSLVGVGAVAGGLAIVHAGLPFPVGLLVAVIAAGLLGWVNGLIIVKARIPALVATLGMLYAARGLIMIVTEGQPIFPFPREATDLVIARVAGVPVMVLLAIALAVIAHYALNHLRFGREVWRSVGTAKPRDWWVSGSTGSRSSCTSCQALPRAWPACYRPLAWVRPGRAQARTD
ncbi:MAG: ABC transporter permease [Chloroflexota bacterium]